MTSTNRATSVLGIEHPIVQGPFGGGLSTVELAATVSTLGGLGSYGAHVLDPDRIESVTGEIRERTAKPFAINLWISDHDPGGVDLTQHEYDEAYRVFEPWYRELEVDKPDRPAHYHPDSAAQIDALLEARPPVFSFVFGIPESRVLAECRRREIVTIGTATSIAEAQALDSAGVDLIVATGAEAGGHRPSFLHVAEEALTGTFALTQLISPRVKAPVIAAGGIVDARGVRAAQMLGAAAAQLGTAFLACRESGAHERHRAELFSANAQSTVLTRAFSGRLARGLSNRWTDGYASLAGKSLPAFPVTSWFTSQLRPAALEAGRTDLISLWSGQIAPNLEHRNATQLMTALLNG